MKPIRSTVKFVKKHRVAIAIIGTACVCMKINEMAMSEHDNFLKDKGLYDEFYTPEGVN